MSPSPTLQIEGRFIIDASNVSEGRVPLNGKTAKEQTVLRYGAVCLPNIRGVLSRWDDYRRHWNLQWSDLLIFKENIKSCFNLRWSTRSSKLLATMVDPSVVFVMLLWQSPPKKVSLLPVRTSSDITLIVWLLQSNPSIGRLISSSTFYSVLVVPIGNHWCYGNVSLHWLICTHMWSVGCTLLLLPSFTWRAALPAIIPNAHARASASAAFAIKNVASGNGSVSHWPRTLVSSIGHIFAHIRIYFTAMEDGVRCQPLAACGWPIWLRVQAPSLLDNSITAFFLGGCPSLPNATRIPDRSLQDLFSRSPWYDVIPMG